MTQNDVPEGAVRRGGEPAHDTTQTFGHDSDLSFVPFGAELTEVEQAARIRSGNKLK